MACQNGAPSQNRQACPPPHPSATAVTVARPPRRIPPKVVISMLEAFSSQSSWAPTPIARHARTTPARHHTPRPMVRRAKPEHGSRNPRIPKGRHTGHAPRSKTHLALGIISRMEFFTSLKLNLTQVHQRVPQALVMRQVMRMAPLVHPKSSQAHEYKRHLGHP